MSATILIGDCRERLKELADASVDSVVCDPPYHLTAPASRKGRSNLEQPKDKDLAAINAGAFRRLAKGFMGQEWDGGDVAFQPETWAEVLRVLKPGGHLVAFSGTRTYHRMVCAIEDAGFEIRDQLAWVYGSGFPKSLDVSKAIDKQRDDRPDILRVTCFVADAAERVGKSRADIDAHMGTSDMAGWWTSRLLHRCQCPKWDQWLQLKLLLALGDEMDAEVWRLNGRKGTPGEAWDDREVIGRATDGSGNGSVVGLGTKGSLAVEYDITAPATEAAQQWQGWGTALKPSWEPICLARKPLIGSVAANVLAHGTGALNVDGCRIDASPAHKAWGRFNENTPFAPQGRWPANLCHDGSDEVLAGFPETAPSSGHTRNNTPAGVNKEHSIGRSKSDWQTRGPEDSGSAARFFYCAKATTEERGEDNNHPTVKPVALMRWLVRLVTPPGGTVLDPFMGSGSTLIAADAEQFNAIGIEMSPEYAAIAERRIRDSAGMFADVKVAA